MTILAILVSAQSKSASLSKIGSIQADRDSLGFFVSEEFAYHIYPGPEIEE